MAGRRSVRVDSLDMLVNLVADDAETLGYLERVVKAPSLAGKLRWLCVLRRKLTKHRITLGDELIKDLLQLPSEEPCPRESLPLEWGP